MIRTRLGDSVKVIATALASLLVSLPLYVFRGGRSQVVTGILAAVSPVFVVLCFESFRHIGRFQQFFAQRSFDGMLFRAFLWGLSTFLGHLVNAVWPSFNTAGLQFGMFVGLVTPVPYATLDYPDATNKSYWTKLAVILGAAYFILVFIAYGRSYHAAVDGVIGSLGYAGGLWLGLVLGNHVNQWIVALQPAFRLLRRLGRTLTAFAVGYLTLILLFSTFFAALWRLQGPGAFAGLPADPGLPVFFYFSLTTATTIGYGDIVPHSGSARCLTGVEAMACLAWTLVVFAALSVQFSLSSKEGSQ